MKEPASDFTNKIEDTSPKISLLILINRSLILLSGTAIASIVLSIIVINSFNKTINQFFNNTNPLVNHLRNIEKHNIFLRNMLNTLQTVKTKEKSKEITKDISSKNFLFLGNIKEIVTIDKNYYNSTLESIYILIERIGEKKEIDITLEKTISDRLNLAQKSLNDTYNTIEYELIDIEYKSLSTNTDISNNKILESTRRLLEHENNIKTLKIILQQSKEKNSVEKIKSNRIEFSEVIRSISSSYRYIEKESIRKKVNGTLNLLFFETNNTIGIYNQLINKRENKLELRKHINSVLIKMDLLDEHIISLLEDANTKNSNSLSSIKKYGHLVPLILFSSAVAVILIAYYSVRITQVNVATPLKKITSKIVSLSQGKTYLGFEKTDTREIYDIDKAMVIFNDTAIKLDKKEGELEIKNSQLEQKTSRLSIFIRVASHDLKSPLRAIKLTCEMINEILSEQVHKQSDIDLCISKIYGIQTRADRLNMLLDALLEYNQVGSEKSPHKEVQLKKMIQEQKELLHNENLFSLNVESSVLTITTEEAAISCIIRNLLDNAIKHHDRKTGILAVKIRPKNKYGVEIFIEDDGPGIATHYQERVFRPLEVLQSHDKVEGAGMGLALVKKIVEEQKGDIHIRSPLTSTRGCRFILEWPCEYSIESANG